MDIAPTLYDIAKISYPSEFNGNSLFPLKGKSLLPFISGSSKNHTHKRLCFWIGAQRKYDAEERAVENNKFQ